MRSERSVRKKNKHTKVLFKKSDLTVGRSSIFSDASQRYAKSAISRMRKDLRQSEYYSDKGKVKRDLSLETDICILRRFCKCKLMSLGASSAKSKYSTFNGTEQGTIEEFEDSSASGDNRPSNKSNVLNVDITVLMMENLRNLLNVWIKKHLMDDDEMKQKFNDVLDSILQKLDSKHTSRTTYILDRDSKGLEIQNEQPSLTCSTFCQICKKTKLSSPAQKLHKRHSCHSSGKTINTLKIISTLSIPRKFYETRSITINKIDQKHNVSRKQVEGKRTTATKMFASPRKSAMVSVCATSSTKNCFVLTGNNNLRESDIHMLKIFPKLFYKSSEELKKDDTIPKVKGKNKKPFDTVPSLVRTMYIDDPANITSTDANFVLESRKEEFTMTEFQKPHMKARPRNINTLLKRSDKAVQKKKISIGDAVEKKHDNAIKSKNVGCPCSVVKAHVKDEKHKVSDFIKSSKRNFLPAREKIARNKNRENITNNKNSLSRVSDPKKNMHRPLSYKLHSSKLRDFRAKRSLAQDMRKNIFKKSPEKELEGQVKRIIRYFFEHNGSRSIKFDVKINICPFLEQNINNMGDNDIGDKKFKDTRNGTKGSNEQSVVNIDNIGYAPPTVLIYTENGSDRYPAIIPLLDGAASHAKYMVDSKNSTTDGFLDNTNTTVRDNVTSEDINELKTIVSNITHTTEKLVEKHLNRKLEKCKNIKSDTKTEGKHHKPRHCFTKVETKKPAGPKQSYTKNEGRRHKPCKHHTKFEGKTTAVPHENHSKARARAPRISNQSYTIAKAKLQTIPKQSYTKLESKLPAVHNQSYTKVKVKLPPVPNQSYTKVETKLPTVVNQSLRKVETKSPVAPIESPAKVDTTLQTMSIQSYAKLDTKSQAVPSPSYVKVEAKEIQTVTSSNSDKTKVATDSDNSKPTKVQTQIKGIQMSAATKSPLTGFSGLKLIKDPKKAETPRYKPTKKCASYAIIESETILRVTDMTLAEAAESVEKALPLKSKSLVNIQTKFAKPRKNIDKTRIITFYCDECSKKYEYIYNSDGSVKKIKKDEPETKVKDELPENHATRVIENYYELSNGVYPETKIDYSSLKPCKLNVPCRAWIIKLVLYSIFVCVLVTVTGSLIYFSFLHPTLDNAVKSKDVLSSPMSSRHRASPSFVVSKPHYVRVPKHAMRTNNIKSPGFRWFASELGF